METPTENGARQRAKMIVISHTHWDREWYQPFQVFRARLIDLIDDVLEILAVEPEYRYFTLDGQTVVLEDYLELRPERRATLVAHGEAGRLLVGPWYVLPDEFIVGAESLVRNLLIGRRLARAFGGGMDVGYLPDQFGHVGQMPQLLRGFGIDTAVLWRGVPPALAGRDFRWRAADGSEVFTIHLGEGYFNAVRLPLAAEELKPRLAKLVEQLAPRGENGVLALMNGSDHVFPQRELPRVLAALRALLPDVEVAHGTLPQLAAEARRRAAARAGELPPHAGELRHSQLAPVLPGVLSARTWLKQRNSACERLLLSWAEPMAAWATLAGVAEGRLPAWRATLRRAWQYLLQNHAHDSICGCSVDAVHEEMRGRFDWVDQMATQVAERARRQLAAAVATPAPAAGEPAHSALVVFNPLGGPRSDFVALRARVPAGEVPALRQADGGEATLQVLARRRAAPAARNMHGELIGTALDLAGDGEAEELELGLLARDVPPWGYCTYYVTARQAVAGPGAVPPAGEGPAQPRLASGGSETAQTPVRAPGPAGGEAPPTIENEHFRLAARADGSFDLLDKASGRVWQRLALLVDGGDAGDEYNYCPPSEDRLLAGATAPVAARVVEDGPARWTLMVQGMLRLPRALAADRRRREAAEVENPFVLRGSLYPSVRRVDFALEVENRAADHRLRLHFPLGRAVATACAEGHFELVERPATPAGGGADWIEQPIGTAPQQGLVLAGGLALAAPGLPEYEVVGDDGGSALALTLLRCVGWLSRADLATRRDHAGPGIPTPGAQELGRHAFAFAVFPHAGAPAEALGEAHRFANPLVAQATGLHEGRLPVRGSFLDVSPPQMVVTAIKPPEDGEGLVVRLYNPSPTPTTAELSLWRPPAAAVLADLEERPLRPMPSEGGRVQVALGGWQIATLRLTWPPGS